MDFNYKQKVDAQNTYTLKLCTTHAANYTEAPNNTEAVGPGLTNNIGDQNAFKPYWYLPVIGGNHIKNCLMRVSRVTIPTKCYGFKHATAEAIRIPDDSLYIECGSVMNKSFVTNNSNSCILKGVVGSISTTDYTSAQPWAHTARAKDNDWILAANPFGSAFHLSLISPSTLASPVIKSTLTAVTGAGTVIENYPIVYELEIKLLPDHQSNDKATY